MRRLLPLFTLVVASAALAQKAAPCKALEWVDGGVRCAAAVPAVAAPAAAIDAGAAPLGVEPFGPAVEQFEAPSSGPTVLVTGSVLGSAAVDTTWESPRRVDLAEQVWGAQLRARVAVDVKLTSSLRLFVEGKAWMRVGSERDFDRTKVFFEPSLGEAFVDLYTGWVDLRVGTQRITLGANALAPADALNPRDLRVGLLSQDADDGVVPVLAIRAQGELGRVGWLAAYAPFFTPSRFVLFGQDEGLLQPAVAPAMPTRRIDPTVEDGVQERLIETRRPVGFLGDVALRVASTGRIKVGASWAWINEKLPQVTIDSELQTLLSSQSTGRAVDPAVAVSVQQRLAANEQLFKGVYARQHIFSAEGSILIGPGQLDLDLSFSPRQTFFDANFAPLSKSAVTWVVGYSTAEDSALIWGASYLGMAVPEVGASEQLLLFEPATAVGAARTAWLHLFLASVSFTFWEDRFVVGLSGAFEPVQRSFSLAPRVTFQGLDGLKLWAGAEFFEGSPYSPLGYFGRNDQLVVGARYELF